VGYPCINREKTRIADEYLPSLVYRLCIKGTDLLHYEEFSRFG
jgi:hypothetical protein